MQPFLDLRRLRYFRAIVQAGSMSAASRVLNVAQPALTHHVAKLESAAGSKLLERRHDGVVPTPAGRVLLEHAETILSATRRAEEALREIAGVQHHAAIALRVTIISSLVSQLTPALVTACAQRLPHVSLSIIEARTLHSAELIQTDKADLSVHLSNSDAVETQPLAMERLFLACRGLEAPGDGPVTLREALCGPLILPGPGNPLRAYMERAAEREGVRLRVAFNVDGPAPRKQAVLSGLGTSIFGAHTINGWESEHGLTARPIVEPVLTRPILMSSRAGLDRSTEADIRDILTECLSAIV